MLETLTSFAGVYCFTSTLACPCDGRQGSKSEEGRESMVENARVKSMFPQAIHCVFGNVGKGVVGPVQDGVLAEHGHLGIAGISKCRSAGSSIFYFILFLSFSPRYMERVVDNFDQMRYFG